MKYPSFPRNENERLKVLKDYKILDTLPEEIFDDFTYLASQIGNTPISLITLVDENRQWFKSKLGLDLPQTQRNISFCGHAILGQEVFEVPNALQDDRFFDNPLVTGEPDIRFYAGAPLLTEEGFSLGTLCVIDRVPHQLSAAQKVALEKLAKQVASQIQYRQTIFELADMSLMLESTGEMAKVGGWELDLADMQLEWTKEVFRIHELEPPAVPTIKEAINFYPPETQPVIQASIRNAIDNGVPWEVELPFVTAKQNKIWVRAQGSAIYQNGKITRLKGVFQDITERKENQIELARLNRTLQMLSKCNELLIHAEDELDLIVEISRIAVEVGGYLMAWVGYADDDEDKSIIPKAYFGHNDDFLDNIELSWSEQQLKGLGPAGKTIRDGLPIVVKDLALDPTYPLKEAAAIEGYRSIICLPLKNKTQTYGFLALYSGYAHNYAKEEINLLQNLSDNLAAGILNIRAEKERKKLQVAMLTVANAVSSNVDGMFFHQLLTNITGVLEAQAGYISEFISEAPWKARTIAVQVDDQVVDNFEYIIPDTLVNSLLNSTDVRIIIKNADKNYPHLTMMKFYKYQAFASLRLINASGKPIGLLFVLFKNALKQEAGGQINSLLKIFATRTANELERMKTAALINEQASLLDKTHDAIIVRDTDHQITFWNVGAEALYGWIAKEAVGQPMHKLLHYKDEEFREAVNTVLRSGEWNGEITNRHKNGDLLIIESHWTLVKDEYGQSKSILAIEVDISERKKAEDEIKQLAFYDPLTQLPNRRLFINRLEQAINLTQRKKQFCALIFIDLDNFKSLNDTHDHDKGDILLKEIAIRLKKCIRNCDTAARLGGDEFVMILEDLGTEKSQAKIIAEVIGNKVLKELDFTFSFDAHSHISTSSIGLAMFNHHNSRVEELLKNADIAMYKSKTSGRNKLTFS